MPEIKDGVEILHAKPVPRPGRWVSAAVVALLAAMVLRGLVFNPNFQWPIVWEWLFSRTIMVGVLNTLVLTVLAMVLGTALAITMAVMRQSPNPILRGVATFYIWFFRGTPIYTQLIFWSLLPTLLPTLGLGIPFGPQFLTVTLTTGATLNFTLAFIGLGLNEGAYLAEIIRSGLLSVDRGQWEAATALGMHRGKIFRRIVFPQAMRVIVPPIGNETISMLKTTSLVSAIPVTTELTFVAQTKGQQLFAPIPLLLAAAIWYLVITSILMVVQSRIERHYGRGFDQRAGSGRAATGGGRDAPGASDTVHVDPFLEVTP